MNSRPRAETEVWRKIPFDKRLDGEIKDNWCFNLIK